MTSRPAVLVMLILLLLAPGISRSAEEPVGAHTQHTPKSIIIDNERIEPSSLDMAAEDALVFENHSTRPITVNFIEPADLRDRIRCGLIRPGAKTKSRVPWQLFSWSDGKLAATIPSGRFASVCSLQQGTYTFIVTPLGPGVNPASGGKLPEKGQITVK